MLCSMVALIALALVGTGAFGPTPRDITDEEYARFPKLYHLDDYESCLARAGGLYCLGTFHINPTDERDPVYQLMMEYSLGLNCLNHTLIHRGYCVSARCPLAKRNGSLLAERHASLLDERSDALRFERCTAQWARRQRLRASLAALGYCRSHDQHYANNHKPAAVDTPTTIFSYVLTAILLLNFFGTLYDVTAVGKKNELLKSWSVASNWPRLIAPSPDKNPGVAAQVSVEGGRVLLMLLVIYTHSVLIQAMLYVQNPKKIEEMFQHPSMIMIQNGTSVVQILIMLSSFFLAHSLLNMKRLPSFWLLPKLIMKRYVRITPVYLLVVGFAATWWARLGDGPLWPALVARESALCRRKFWPHAFYLHNFIEPENICQLQTWSLAVDFQLYVLSCAMTLCLSRARASRVALRLLAAMFLAACALNAALAYIHGWKPLMYEAGPESIRNGLRPATSFFEFYLKPFSSLPACFAGLFVAFLHHDLHDRGFKPTDHKRLMSWCQLTFVLLPAWVMSGRYFRQFSSPAFMALYMGLERPVLTALAAVILFATYNGVTKDHGKGAVVVSARPAGLMHAMFCWRGWYPLGRASLAALMLHWCINMTIKAHTLTPVTTSPMDLVSDWLATSCLTYLLAVPVTLLVDMPCQRLYSALTSTPQTIYYTKTN